MQTWHAGEEVVRLSMDGGLLAASTRATTFRMERGPSDRIWRTDPRSVPAEPRKARPVDPPPGSGGAFLSCEVDYQGRHLLSFWGAKVLYVDTGRKDIGRPPTEGDYDLLSDGPRLWAGTPNGLYVYEQGRWSKVPLPIELPCRRPNGFAASGSRAIVGGLDGLWIGRPGDWKRIDDAPVRQILADANGAWVLYGSGAVDRLVPKEDRLYPDLFQGASRRPWASCIARSDGRLLVGGYEGWIERPGNVERYPVELKGEVVTAAAAKGATRWIGTQKGGLIRFDSGKPKRWNPGNGLSDPWVTSLLHTPSGLYVATAGTGLYLLQGDTLRPVQAPTTRIRHLALWRNQVVVGAMDGAWLQDVNRWTALPTNSEETTSLLVGNRLVITSPTAVRFVSYRP